MHIKSVGLSALLLALVPAAGFAVDAPAASASTTQDVEHVLSMSVEGTLLVDTDGSVRDYALTSPVPPNLAAALGKVVKGWRFEPVLVDGQLVRAEAKMRISLAATKDGDNYQVRVENAVFRPATPAAGKGPISQTNAVEATGRRLNPPVYPRELQRAGISGRVLVAMHFSPEGKVIEVVPVQGMIFDTSGHDRTIAKAIHMLESATVTAARRWSVMVKVTPGVATTAKDFTAYTTVDYVMGKSPQLETAGEWRMVARTPKRTLPWLAGADAPNVGVADVGSGETFALADALRLKSPLGGSSL